MGGLVMVKVEKFVVTSVETRLEMTATGRFPPGGSRMTVTGGEPLVKPSLSRAAATNV